MRYHGSTGRLKSFGVTRQSEGDPFVMPRWLTERLLRASLQGDDQARDGNLDIFGNKGAIDSRKPYTVLNAPWEHSVAFYGGRGRGQECPQKAFVHRYRVSIG